jgi:LysM repeat protein
MPSESRKSSGRFLGPLALGLVVAAFLFVIVSSGGSNSNTKKDSSSTDTTAQKTSKQGSGKRSRPTKSTYTVKTGDTLGAIAAKVGLTVEKLQELNPDLDPQALVSGQKIKLRE